MTVSTSIYGATLTTLSLIKSYLGGDGKKNAEPIHSTEYDIDADEHNRIVAGLAEIAARTRVGNVSVIHFSQPDATAGQTAVVLARDGAYDLTVTEHVAPWAGSIVGLSVSVENARSAGTLTIHWTNAGTPGTLASVIDGTDDQRTYDVQLPGVDTFAAGARLGVTVTTDGSWAAGTTPSLSVDLVVAYGD
jgi:hypothetical protein